MIMYQARKSGLIRNKASVKSSLLLKGFGFDKSGLTLYYLFFVLGPAEILHVGYKDHLIRLKLNEIEIVETILKLVELLITYLIEFWIPVS